MSLQIGQVLEGKYRVERVIGEGGMGAVYEAVNVRIQRRVAIKVVHAAFAANEQVVARFEREAQAAGRIGNDHILEVVDLGTLSDGAHFMVLEYLDGEPLSSRIRRLGRLSPRETAALARQMLTGLAAAHAAGIVHRDLKPDNVFILKEKAGTPDFVKIIDFGISKFQPLSGDAMKMTSTGAVMGTPYYMSPEQARGESEVGARSDLYSVGVILYECMTGRLPFEGETFNELMFKIVLSDPPHPHELVPDLDVDFVAIVLKAMARSVGERFQTSREFSDSLEAWMGGAARTSDPPLRSPAPIATSGDPVHGRPRADLLVTADPARVTAGSWATTQPAPLPPRTTIVLAAIAGGVVLAGAAVAGVLLLRSARPASSPVPVASAIAKFETVRAAEPPHANGAAAARDEPPLVQTSPDPASPSPPPSAATQRSSIKEQKLVGSPRQRPETPDEQKGRDKPSERSLGPAPAGSSKGLDFGY